MHLTAVGHRGAGANGPFPIKPVQILENTIKSFSEAIKLGAQMIEFDVQITKDLMPVIFHDFYVCRSSENVQISDLNYQELIDIINNGSINAGCLKGNRKESDYEIEMDQVPLLEEALTVTPPVDFNVEVKYPYQDEIEDQKLQPQLPIDQYCKIINDTISKYAGSRRIVYSSFHPEVCAWLKSHSPYEVFFLTDAGVTISKYDPRLNSLEAAIDFARKHRLNGIVANAKGLLSGSSLPDFKGLKLWSYGKENCDPELVRTQLKLGVSGIITDDLASLRSLLQERDL